MYTTSSSMYKANQDNLGVQLVKMITTTYNSNSVHLLFTLILNICYIGNCPLNFFSHGKIFQFIYDLSLPANYM